jgi:hypothetical protein
VAIGWTNGHEFWKMKSLGQTPVRSLYQVSIFRDSSQHLEIFSLKNRKPRPNNIERKRKKTRKEKKEKKNNTNLLSSSHINKRL